MRDDHARKVQSSGDRMTFALIAIFYAVELTYVLALGSLRPAHMPAPVAVSGCDSDPRTLAVALVIVFGVLTVCTTIDFVGKLRRKPASGVLAEDLMKALETTAGIAVIAGSVLLGELLRR